LLGSVHQLSDLGETLAQAVGDLPPLLASGFFQGKRMNGL
jgi:hypothetical protein